MKDSLIFSCLLSLVLLFLTTASRAESTENSNEGSLHYIPVKYRQKEVRLVCNVRAPEALELRWSKDNVLLNLTTDEYKDRFTIKPDDEHTYYKTLVISNPTQKDLGIYMCQVYNRLNQSNIDNLSATFNVMSDLTIKMDEASTFIEGEALKLKCLVTSNSKPHKIVWQFENTTYESSKDRVTLSADEKDIPNAIFQIEKAVMEDRGTYTCMAYATAVSNNATSATTYVRIKDKFAALWPFLGICAEVFVLCTIILIYEKKRNKAEMEESDTDQSPDQKSTADQARGTVRQRN